MHVTERLLGLLATDPNGETRLASLLKAYNPDQERDEDGRFAFGGGSGGRLSADALHEHAAAELRQVNPNAKPELVKTYAEMMGYDKPGRDYWKTSEGHLVVFDNLKNCSDADKKALVDHLGELQKAYPDGSKMVVVQDDRSFEIGHAARSNGDPTAESTKGALASCWGGLINLRESLVNGERDAKFRDDAQRGFFSPIATQSSASEYCLTHEYGHSLDQSLRGDSDQGSVGATARVLADHWASSDYGSTNDYEKFAEAFAEYHLSEGKTGDPLALALARDQGWAK